MKKYNSSEGEISCSTFETDPLLELSPREIYDTTKHFQCIRKLSMSEKQAVAEIMLENALCGEWWLPASAFEEHFPGWRISVLRYAHDEGHEVFTGLGQKPNPATGCPDAMGIRIIAELLEIDKVQSLPTSALDDFSEKPTVHE